MVAAIPSFANFGTDNSERFDAALMRAPEIVKARIGLLQKANDTRDALFKGRNERLDKLRSKRDEERIVRDRIAADESKQGAMIRTRVLPDGSQETVTVNRLAPLDEKIKRLDRELIKEQATAIPHVPPVPAAFLATTTNLSPVAEPKVRSADKAECKRAADAADAVLAEIKTIQDAPRPLADVLRHIDEEWDRLVAQGEPRLGSLFKGGRHNARTGKFQVDVPYAGIGWRKMRVRGEFDTGYPLTMRNDLAASAWLHPEGRERLRALATAHARDDIAMTVQEKLVALADAYARALNALRYEAALNFAVLESTGHVVDWRRNLHPALLLGVVVDPTDALAWND